MFIYKSEFCAFLVELEDLKILAHHPPTQQSAKQLPPPFFQQNGHTTLPQAFRGHLQGFYCFLGGLEATEWVVSHLESQRELRGLGVGPLTRR